MVKLVDEVRYVPDANEPSVFLLGRMQLQPEIIGQVDSRCTVLAINKAFLSIDHQRASALRTAEDHWIPGRQKIQL